LCLINSAILAASNQLTVELLTLNCVQSYAVIVLVWLLILMQWLIIVSDLFFIKDCWRAFRTHHATLQAVWVVFFYF